MSNPNIECQKCIDLTQKYDISTHDEFGERYNQEYGHTFTQGSFARRLKKFHIVKVEGVYKYQPETIDGEAETQQLLFNHCDYISLVHSDFNIFVARCEIGAESIICKLIYEKFYTKLHSIIPAYGSVVIICKSKKNAKEIREYIKKYIRNKNDGEDN